MNRTEPTILLVEDSEDDAFLMNRALKQAGAASELKVVTDGQQALDYLEGSAGFGDRQRFPLPDVLFLDLKLPYVTGFEVLAWLRERREFDSIRVVILTGSAENRDRDKAKALGAQEYLVKPPTRESLRSVFESLYGRVGR